MNSKFRIVIFCASLLVLIGSDRLTKEIAKEHLRGREPVSWFHDTFRLDYVENTGAFLSLGAGLSKQVSFWVFSMIPLAFMAGLGVYVIRKRREMTLVVYLSMILILAGGAGNIIDRLLFDRHVSDFMNVGIGNLRTGIFNMADLYVTTGVVLLFFFAKKKVTQEPNIQENLAENS